AVAAAFESVESKVEQAMKKGYEAVKALGERTLFHWIGKILYGVVFNEIQAGVRQSFLSGEPMNFSQVLVHKFRNLHEMLQSFIVPFEFVNYTPITIYNFLV